MLTDIATQFKPNAPAVDFWSLRLLERRYEGLMVRQAVAQPITNIRSTGALVTVVSGKGCGYAATSDLTQSGLTEAVQRAIDWAHASEDLHLVSTDQHARADQSGDYHTPIERPWNDWSLKDKFDFLSEANQRLKSDAAIVDWAASMSYQTDYVLLINGEGTEIRQRFADLKPGLVAVANRGSETQKRSFGFDRIHRGGLERLDGMDLLGEAQRIGAEALELLQAPHCPSGPMDVLLLPGQMLLQIHESIGHPLELDRILGDERNYAGASFVKPEMFGTYRYGSDLLNVTFNPNRPEQVASYAFDDEGTPAEHQYLIRHGILQRPLGGVSSQQRAGLPGVANARSCDWNRPAIDRMANLNLEPGDASLGDMIASIERGVLMDTNRSWSIDDHRNKFQFGCEYGRLIVDGELTRLVKNSSYRGVSATFWRNLAMTGNADTFKVLAVANCGKGEPNQAIQVGHASPACVFKHVEVFGGS
jgi:predicted Zn-dependent protease